MNDKLFNIIWICKKLIGIKSSLITHLLDSTKCRVLNYVLVNAIAEIIYYRNIKVVNKKLMIVRVIVNKTMKNHLIFHIKLE